MLSVKSETARSGSSLFWALLGGLLILPLAAAEQSLDELKAVAKKKRDPAALAAQYQLGRRYLLGIGTAVDEKEAFDYLKDAADKGNITEAIHMVAVCYATGTGVKMNDKEAVRYFDKAATGGHAEAQFKLGACFQNGLLKVKPDTATAMKWYLAAAKQGHPRAQYKYADLVYKIPDAVTSAEWFRKAAEQGVIEAQIMTGHLYKLGQAPGGKDMIEAYKWYLIAARMGHPEAVKQVEDMPRFWKSDLDEKSLLVARQRAEAYLKQHDERIQNP